MIFDIPYGNPEERESARWWAERGIFELEMKLEQIGNNQRAGGSAGEGASGDAESGLRQPKPAF
jgi:hypothetical protein